MRGLLVGLALALVLVPCWGEGKGYTVPCAFHYPRHTLKDVVAGKVTPYLFGGIYKRPCVNCRRGGLWATWCGWSNTTLPFYDQQLCTKAVTQAVIKEAAVRRFDAGALTMTPCDLWYYMRGRTTWIIGDSMSKDLFKALRCFMVEFHDLHTYQASSNFTVMYSLHNIPHYGEPHCIHMPDNTKLCQIHAIQGDLFVNGSRIPRGVLPQVYEVADPSDLFVVNFGLWHGTAVAEEYRQHLHELGAFLQARRETFPNVFWMQTPKQHFDSTDGDYKDEWVRTRKGPFQCHPIKNVRIDKWGLLRQVDNSTDPVAAYVMDGTWRNLMAQEILGRQYDVPIVPVYNVTVPAWGKHRANAQGQECSHYCHPGIPQLWVFTLMRTWHNHFIRDIKNPLRRKKVDKPCIVAWEREEKHLGDPLPVAEALPHAAAITWALAGLAAAAAAAVAVGGRLLNPQGLAGGLAGGLASLAAAAASSHKAKHSSCGGSGGRGGGPDSSTDAAGGAGAGGVLERAPSRGLVVRSGTPQAHD